jgi:hypothetical protein
MLFIYLQRQSFKIRSLTNQWLLFRLPWSETQQKNNAQDVEVV